MNQQFLSIVEALESFREETEVSKHMKEKITQIIIALQNDHELCKDKALYELEQLGNLEMLSYTRTQLWSIISMLEGI